MYRATAGVACGEALPENMRGLTGVELLAEVQKFAPEGACVPRALAELDEAEVRFPGVVGAGAEGVEDAVREWLMVG